jgi:hypothetical protein
MIRGWSPEARLVLAFVAAPLVVPLLFSIPFFLMGVISGEWAIGLISLVVGAVVTYLNAFVVAAPVWIIFGRSRLVRNHWPLTIGGWFSGAMTVLVFASQPNITGVALGGTAGLLTALLFWVIALREASSFGQSISD